MLSAFQLENNRLTRLEVEESQPLVNAVWIDLVEPDDDERLRVQSELGQSLATRPELEDIEASARFFEDDDGLHIHSFFFFEDAEDHAGNSTVAFTIRDGRLFTLRERELPAFRLYRMRARSQSMVDGNAYELLLDRSFAALIPAAIARPCWIARSPLVSSRRVGTLNTILRSGRRGSLLFVFS